MQIHHSVRIEVAPGLQHGALDGWRAVCSCGTHLATSLGERWANKLGSEHLAWHARRGY